MINSYIWCSRKEPRPIYRTYTPTAWICCKTQMIETGSEQASGPPVSSSPPLMKLSNQHRPSAEESTSSPHHTRSPHQPASGASSMSDVRIVRGWWKMMRQELNALWVWRTNGLGWAWEGMIGVDDEVGRMGCMALVNGAGTQVKKIKSLGMT
jgi:hypothetical protein